MTYVRRYWWVLPAILAGAYWIFRAWYDKHYTTLLVYAVILAVAGIVSVLVRRRNDRETGRTAED